MIMLKKNFWIIGIVTTILAITGILLVIISFSSLCEPRIFKQKKIKVGKEADGSFFEYVTGDILIGVKPQADIAQVNHFYKQTEQ